MCVRIEDAGFEIRDMIAWVYGQGFPKSLDVSKAIDKAAGAEREVVGQYASFRPNNHADTKYNGNLHTNGSITAPATDSARQWSGWGTALKPAMEPITVARKPLSGTVAENVQEWGTGAINVDGCRVGTSGGTCRDGKADTPNDAGWENMRGHGVATLNAGRWPANIIHDGSEEVEALTGSAARFFYCAKASKADRDDGLQRFEVRRTGGMQATADGSMLTGSGNERTTARANHHPTVKPTALMQYLCRLVTPSGGTVLDPFTGSGSTGRGAILEGFNFIGIEREAEYVEIARARIAEAERRHSESLVSA
jgi:site-specific DNA-methyltransferase (adenine-specific)